MILMNNIRKSLALSVLSFVFLLSYSSPGKAGFSGVGLAQLSCGEFVTHYKADDAQHYANVAWALGLITGANWKTDSMVASGVDSSSIVLALAKYCQDNPFDSLIQASISTYNQLEEMRN